MSKPSSANNRSATALRQLESQGLAFTNEAFVAEFAFGGNLQNVALYIEAGIDVNMPVDGLPPIVLLANFERSSCEIAQLLIDSGADVNRVSENGTTAIRSAIFKNHKELLRLFIENGADVCAADHDGATAIHVAAVYNHTELARLLIENGADVNAVSKNGLTAMHVAAVHNHTELVRLLIENGADVNAVNKSGVTAMHIALSDNRKELMQLLIENGAEPNPQTAPEDVIPEKLEITNIVERLELLEEKFGIAISALYASCYYQSYGTPPYHEVTINFDVTSLSGGKLERSFIISASAYNLAGQLLGTTSTYINNENFMGFDPKSILCHLDQAPAKIRLFPSVYA